jgi:hypothetical protein
MKNSLSLQSLRDLIQAAQQKELYLSSLPRTSFQEQKLIRQMETRRHQLQFFEWMLQQVSQKE